MLKIPYQIKKSTRARHLRITIYRNCSVVVTLPSHKMAFEAENFLLQKAHWIKAKLAQFKKLKNGLFLDQSAKFKENKVAAFNLATGIINQFNSFYKFKINKITIKNQKTRWGSCSKKGNLNFNYKIALLPRHLAEYIVVHELCHLQELNHGKRFWALVAKTIPYYQKFKKELKGIY